MATIIFADDTNRYDGRTRETRPLGGTESSVCFLTEALAARGHEVIACTNCEAPIAHNGVTWIPLTGPKPRDADIYVPVQHPRLFGLIENPRRRFVWLCWRPNNLRHYKNIGRMWWYRPFPIFISEHQAAIYPRIVPQPARKTVIPLGLPDHVRGQNALPEPPPPHAIFASNPARGLDWLIRLWAREIHPRVPEAELHVYGIRDYSYSYGGTWAAPADAALQAVLAEVPERARRTIVFNRPVPPQELAQAMRSSRAMLYGGHKSEMFCLALAEAQALGVPAVIRPVAVLPERVADETTGFIRHSDADFADAAIRLLTDDRLWRRQHEAALATRQGLSWAEVAERFEQAFGLAPARAADALV